jgi:hypothetical protein
VSRDGGGPSREDGGRGRSKKACCLVSELLEEAGIDRESIRTVRRQVLEGVMLFCRWQLEKMDAAAAGSAAKSANKGRKVRID